PTLFRSFKIKHEDKIWADIPVDALDADAPVYYLKSKEAKYYQTFQNQETETPKVTDHGEMLKTLLTRETIASKEWVYKQFDSNKDNKTLKGPGSRSEERRVGKECRTRWTRD